MPSSTVLDLLWKMSWQVAILAGIVWLVSRAARKAPAAWRHALWLIVLVKFLIPPFAYLPASFAPRQEIAVPAPQMAAAPRPAVQRPQPAKGQVDAGAPMRRLAQPEPITREDRSAISMPTMLCGAWLLGVFIAGGVLIVRIRRQYVLTSSSTDADEATAGLLLECADSIGVRRLPRLRLSKSAATPMLVGVFRPTILLPDDVAQSCGQSDLRAMLLHELAHVKRRDMVWLWTEQLARLVFLFHPALWLASHELAKERELACDELVLRASGITRKDYAAGYVSALGMASSASRVPVALAMAEPFEVEKRRLDWILRQPLRKLSAAWIAALIVAAAFALPTFIGCAKRVSVRATARRIESNIVLVYEKPIMWKGQGLAWRITGVGHPDELRRPPSRLVLTSEMPDIPHAQVDFDMKATAGAKPLELTGWTTVQRDGSRNVGYDFYFAAPRRGTSEIDQISGKISVRPQDSHNKRGPFDLSGPDRPIELEKGKLIVVVSKDHLGQAPRLPEDVVGSSDDSEHKGFVLVLYEVALIANPSPADVEMITLYDARGRKAGLSWRRREMAPYNEEWRDQEVYFGLQMARISEAKRRALNVEGGKVVTCVDPFGPANRAGVMEGDVIVEWEGKSIKNVPDNISWSVSTKPHGLIVLRNGSRLRLAITPVRDPYWYDSDGNLRPIWGMVQSAKRLGRKTDIERLTYENVEPLPKGFVPAKIEFTTRVAHKAFKVVPFSIRNIPIPDEFWTGSKKTSQPVVAGRKAIKGGFLLKYAKPMVWQRGNLRMVLPGVGRLSWDPYGNPRQPQPGLFLGPVIHDLSRQAAYQYWLGLESSVTLPNGRHIKLKGTAGPIPRGRGVFDVEQQFPLPPKGTTLLREYRGEILMSLKPYERRFGPFSTNALEEPRELEKGMLTLATAGWSIGDSSGYRNSSFDAEAGAVAKDFFRASDAQTDKSGYFNLEIRRLSPYWNGSVQIKSARVYGANGQAVQLHFEGGDDLVYTSPGGVGHGQGAYYGFVMATKKPAGKRREIIEVLAVDPRGPAWKAGLRAGDTVTKFLNDQIREQGFVNTYPAGNPLSMTAMRNGRRIDLTIRPEEDEYIRRTPGMPLPSWQSLLAKAGGEYRQRGTCCTEVFSSAVRVAKTFKPVRIEFTATVQMPPIKRIPFVIRDIPIPAEFW